ncbi:DNA internalization-related competence protein ComEC/Rec2 [Bariatricus massiliensis]|uniref:DNA internalization-related competence protein ComEC/Rec2 n=1 Tax=Bariatricus massiliensis TaxID=1745713 RepID=A0ABS8DIP4_9FIRM|nr:DNA internalization-related competence protein ComEC/Rec2 [Bariatricus massiliensis]MCB7305162.1 DNA internalization-related competence protein ComEC/Rec2 [Bariatricus massiliensis]MCB7375730.1 DNA internalization-related competence protein ComEC/Rec2 [Bariatricus massiliensis]MCB7388305.1 DNA internalization-related competence protein ComEC/Rec2 [Bariatricus massiliensis]MCB7412492.1 DNA internalization-related competence protein ComEC/Rec2 [Bariatricus massiliensis]MCQ5254114.1 DNA intern
MRRRYLCQICLGLIMIIVLLRTADEARFFPELRPAVSQQNLKEKEEIRVSGTVRKKSEKDGRLTLELQDITCNGTLVCDERILAYLEEESLPYIPVMGERLLVSGKINFYHQPRNPGNFNQKFYYQKQNIHAFIGDARLDSDSPGKRQRNNSMLYRLKEWLWMVRKKAALVMESYLGEARGGMLSAMLLGEKGLLDSDISEAMSKSGIGHLYAVSGLHVSFFGFGVYRILRKTGLPIGICAAGASLFLLLYVELTGNGVSAVRAYVMFVIRMGAEVSGRVYDGLTALAAAAVFLLIKQPLLLWDAGFLLSFAAVGGIYGVLPILKSCFEGRAEGNLLPGFLTVAAVNLVLIPLMLRFYFELAVYSLIWNVIVVMLAPVVLTAGIGGMILGTASGCLPLAGGVAKLFFFVADKILWFYERGSKLMLLIPGSRFVAGCPSMWQVALYYTALFTGLAVAAARKRKKRNGGTMLRLAVCSIILIGFGILFLPHGKRGRTEVVMLDVGQGDCFFVRGPEGGTYLIDGGSSTVNKAGQYRIEPFLKSQGVGVLDYVFVSHGDADHLNGILELLTRQEVGIEIRNVVLPNEEVWNTALTELTETAMRKGTKIYVMEQGQSLKEKGLTLTCLWPETEYTGEAGNQASMVLSLTYGAFDMLFTGDLEKEGEEAFVRWAMERQREGALQASYEVLKAGHHGSKNGTAQAMLEFTAPRDVFISAGQGNSYGHPHREVLERLAKWGCTLYNTKEQGAVSLSTDGKSYRVKLPMQRRRIIVY